MLCPFKVIIRFCFSGKPKKLSGLLTQPGSVIDSRKKIMNYVFAGKHVGRVTIRQRKTFILNGFDFNASYAKRLHRADGYNYQWQKTGLPVLVQENEKP